MIFGAGVRRDAPSRNRAALQRPQEPFVPLTAPRRLFRYTAIARRSSAFSRLVLLAITAFMGPKLPARALAPLPR